jgi:hypothetical protein
MKVIDIIKPSLNEGLLSKIAIRELSDAAGWAIARAQKYGREIPDVARFLEREGVRATPREIEVIEKAAQKRAAEITKAEKAAYDKENSVLNKAIASTKEIGEGWELFKQKASFITNALIALGCVTSVGSAVWTYYSNVQEAYNQWAAGKLPEADYRYVRQSEMSVMITKIAATFVFVGGTGAVAGILSFFGKIPFLGVPFRLLSGLTKTSQLALAAAFNTPQAKEWLAYAAVYHLSELPVIGPLFEFLGINDDISAYVGGGGVLLLDKLKTLLSEIPGVGSLMDKDPSAVTGPDGKQDQKPVDPANDKGNTGPSTVPANTAQTITAPQDDATTVKLPGGEWIRKDGNKWLNTSTGDMVISKDPNKLSNVAPGAIPPRLLK